MIDTDLRTQGVFDEPWLSENTSSCYMGISMKLYEDVLVYITPSLSFLFRLGAFLAT
jgi:hypothetical protein